MYDHVFPPCFEQILPCHPQTPCLVYPNPVTIVGFNFILVFPLLRFTSLPSYHAQISTLAVYLQYPHSPRFPSPFRRLSFSHSSFHHSFIPPFFPSFWSLAIGVCNVIPLYSKVFLFFSLSLPTGSVIALSFTYQYILPIYMNPQPNPKAGERRKQKEDTEDFILSS